MVGIGVPYGMNLWQESNSVEGTFKISGKNRKELVLKEKEQLHLEFNIEKKDIVGIVH